MNQQILKKGQVAAILLRFTQNHHLSGTPRATERASVRDKKRTRP
jgi:hypothetical protein